MALTSKLAFLGLLLLSFQELNANSQIKTEFENEKKQLSIIQKEMSSSKTLEKGIIKLDKFIKSSKIDPIVLQSKVLYAATVLDVLQKEPYLTNAVRYILPLALEKEIAEYQFIVANLLFLQKQYETADGFLQLACTNSKPSQLVSERCFKMSHIKQSKKD